MNLKRKSKPQPPPLWGRDKGGLNIHPTAAQIVEGIRIRGGRVWLGDDYQLHYRLPKQDFKRLEALLKQHGAGVFQYLLERRPKIEVPVACRCDARPLYPHFTHGWEDELRVRIKGTLSQLRDALTCCQSQSGGWDMSDLTAYMEELSKRKGEL